MILSLPRHLLCASLISTLLTSPLIAGENWGLCAAPSFQPIQTSSSALSPSTVESDFMIRGEDEILIFSGQVEVQRAGQKIQADQIVIDDLSQQMQATGQVVFEDPNYRLQTDSMSSNQKNQSAKFAASLFNLPDQHVSGSASEIFKLTESKSRFLDISYTTCDPGDRDWHMTSTELNIDQDSGRGSATHAVIYFQEIPFLYLPYFQFPIDDRRMSGILTPRVSFSDTSGSNLTVPVYWNIATNLDATITPSWYNDRGLQLSSESRYLFNSNSGQIDLTYLDDEKVNDSRWFQKWRHYASLNQNISADILWQEVSDDDYFDDFELPGSNNVTITHLERRATFSHRSSYWQTGLMWQDYQTPDLTIATSSRPYKRLPRLTINSQLPSLSNGLQFDIQNEWVQFEREKSITGSRLHSIPSISWPLFESWYFLTPKLEYALSEYRLDNNSLGENSIQRDIPIFSLDGGLIFERQMNSSADWVQTLEPRLYFLRTPFEDQSNIPNFDSAVLSETYDNFFKSNRFSGSDRIGDADQVAIGIGTRFLNNETGNELLYFRLGQIYYQEDRLVSLGSSTANDPKSNLIAQLTVKPNSNFTLNAKVVDNEQKNEVTQKELSINYRQRRVAANLGYYFNDQVLEQATISAVYPINSRWTMVAKHQQSLLLDKPVENLFGLNYESCCWGIKILASQTSNDDFTEIDKAIYFELTLKGLGQTSRIIDTQLSNAIPGYSTNF